MSVHAIAMRCPRATVPDLLLSVWIHDDVGDLSPADAERLLCGDRCQLWVPPLETWTLDTVRMLLRELAAFLPADADASASVAARLRKPGGRSGKKPVAPRLNSRVEFAVTARGWRARVVTELLPNLPYADLKWSEPMEAALLELAARSPFHLADVADVLPGDPGDLALRYLPRRGVAPEDQAQWSMGAVLREVRRLRTIADDLLDSLDGE